MTLLIHKSLLRTFIQSMYDEGLINDDFYQVQAMKETIRRDYVVRAITSYCTSTEYLLTQITFLTHQLQVNYFQINTTTRDLHSIATSIGAVRVKIACVQLVQACELRNYGCCIESLKEVKREHSKLRRKFENLVKMERKIIDLECGF